MKPLAPMTEDGLTGALRLCVELIWWLAKAAVFVGLVAFLLVMALSK